MKIKFLTEEGIDNLKEILISTYGKHLLDENSDFFLEDFFKRGWLKESKFEFPDVEFDMNPDYNISDSKNIKILYDNMKTLPPAIAADERVWVGLSFSSFWRYIQYRRAEELKSGSELDIKNSFFFMRGRRRSGFVHCVSRFWWIAHILYDAERENPYELCEYFASRAFPSRAVLFSSVNLVSNPEIAKGIVQCHYDRWKEGKDDGRYPYVEANKFWNCLGGISIVDSFSRQEVYDMTMKFLNDNFPSKV